MDNQYAKLRIIFGMISFVGFTSFGYTAFCLMNCNNSRISAERFENSYTEFQQENCSRCGVPFMSIVIALVILGAAYSVLYSFCRMVGIPENHSTSTSEFPESVPSPVQISAPPPCYANAVSSGITNELFGIQIQPSSSILSNKDAPPTYEEALKYGFINKETTPPNCIS